MRKNIKPWISVQSLLPFRSADVRERHSTARTSRPGKVETLQFSESRLDFVLGHCIHTCHKIRTWTCVFTWVLIWSDCLAVQHFPDVFYFKNHPEDSDDGLSIWPFENRTKWLRRSTLYSPFFTHDTKKRDDFNSTRYWLDFGQAKKYRVYLKKGYPQNLLADHVSVSNWGYSMYLVMHIPHVNQGRIRQVHIHIKGYGHTAMNSDWWTWT